MPVSLSIIFSLQVLIAAAARVVAEVREYMWIAKIVKQ